MSTTTTRTRAILRDIAWQIAGEIVSRQATGDADYARDRAEYTNDGDGWTVRLPGGPDAWEVHEHVHLTPAELERVWTHAHEVAAKHGDDLVLGY